ncbi:putative indoleamine 2,3-dioxygenase [Lyophyllum shimeji]|uniref:Indoleamine 2,3-dioxygenase n=1 Tax=Lyophyllum shimeji TaxID=47721 RepID=A0A9P3UQZ6_LYOSH|nr:putative indoleamine 2,3-dioxygenase [Lyophyllum shimeji]
MDSTQHPALPASLSEEAKANSEAWRNRLRELEVLPITDLKQSEVNLRRAHQVLTYLLHFYVHPLPPDGEIRIPVSISLPLLQVSAELQIPPVMTYGDDVMYNWTLKEPTADGVPTSNNLRSQASFTGAVDEEAFYLAPVRVELRGAEALRLMQNMLDDLSTGSADLRARITQTLKAMTTVIKDLKDALLSVREDCNPDFFYRSIRPWLVGADSDPAKRPWIFEGLERDPSLTAPTQLSGSSAAQSALIQALDIFLGIAKSGPVADASSTSISTPFAQRMRVYMPRRHRVFLEQLDEYGRVLREFVSGRKDAELAEAYNAAVTALKEFRDAHMIIITLYIIGPSKRVAREEAEAHGRDTGMEKELKGSAGGDLARLLKDFRERTTSALLP